MGLLFKWNAFGSTGRNTMTPSRLAVAATVALAPTLAVTLAAPPANATPQVGTCTNSYRAYTYDELAFDADAQTIFKLIDTNKDGVICFKPYPNGAHAGHLGNLVDDKAAPHA
jgi:hypothetical protein